MAHEHSVICIITMEMQEAELSAWINILELLQTIGMAPSGESHNSDSQIFPFPISGLCLFSHQVNGQRRVSCCELFCWEILHSRYCLPSPNMINLQCCSSCSKDPRSKQSCLLGRHDNFLRRMRKCLMTGCSEGTSVAFHTAYGTQMLLNLPLGRSYSEEKPIPVLMASNFINSVWSQSHLQSHRGRAPNISGTETCQAS